MFTQRTPFFGFVEVFNCLKVLENNVGGIAYMYSIESALSKSSPLALPTFRQPWTLARLKAFLLYSQLKFPSWLQRKKPFIHQKAITDIICACKFWSIVCCNQSFCCNETRVCSIKICRFASARMVIAFLIRYNAFQQRLFLWENMKG